MDYMALRQMTLKRIKDWKFPRYLYPWLPEDKNAFLLEIGCGFGQLLRALHEMGHTNLHGVDVDETNFKYLNDTNVKLYANTDDLLCENLAEKVGEGGVDMIFLHHVLEHVEKAKMIDFLRNVKKLLKPGGYLSIQVPNAQSIMGCYWAYEDFTHHYLFTSGSLFFVLKASGYEHIEFVDIDCTHGLPLFKRLFRKFFLTLYKANLFFWHKVTGNAFYKTSPQIFSWEIKVMAR